jgi:YVTN family beta-propeller protein
MIGGAVLTALLLGTAWPAAAGQRVYVPLGGAGEVLVIDASNDRVVATIPNLPEVHGLAGTPDGTYLVAGSLAETEAGTPEIPPKPEGMSAADHQAHHGGSAAGGRTPEEAVSFVSLVRVDEGSVVHRIEVPGAVHHVAVTPDGRHAIATHPNGGGISVIDLSARRLAEVIPTGPLPNYTVVSADGTRAYVSNAGNNSVSEIDTASWRVLRNIATGESPEHMVLSPDGGRLFVNNVDEGTVSEISIAEAVVSRVFELGGLLHGIDVSDDGRTLFVAGREENRLFAIDLASGEASSTPLAPSPYHLTAIAGTGKLYVSSAEEPKIWVVDQRSLEVLREIPIRGKGHQMVQTGG